MSRVRPPAPGCYQRGAVRDQSVNRNLRHPFSRFSNLFMLLRTRRAHEKFALTTVSISFSAQNTCSSPCWRGYTRNGSSGYTSGSKNHSGVKNQACGELSAINSRRRADMRAKTPGYVKTGPISPVDPGRLSDSR